MISEKEAICDILMQHRRNQFGFHCSEQKGQALLSLYRSLAPFTKPWNSAYTKPSSVMTCLYITHPCYGFCTYKKSSISNLDLNALLFLWFIIQYKERGSLSLQNELINFLVYNQISRFFFPTVSMSFLGTWVQGETECLHHIFTELQLFLLINCPSYLRLEQFGPTLCLYLAVGAELGSYHTESALFSNSRCQHSHPLTVFS